MVQFSTSLELEIYGWDGQETTQLTKTTTWITLVFMYRTVMTRSKSTGAVKARL